jgi:hypothetical protein
MTPDPATDWGEFREIGKIPIYGSKRKVMRPEKKSEVQHAFDCTIYSSIMNGRPCDGICTCGYGWKIVRSSGDFSQMYSKERLETMSLKSRNQQERPTQ